MDGGEKPPSHVSLVLVSHSRKVALGTADLVSQVARRVTVIAVGGRANGSLGSDGSQVSRALTRVCTDGTGVVLADIGSAVLVAKAAIAALGDEDRQRVALADAPFVEGAIAAASVAEVGASLEQVVRAAEEARCVSKF